VGEQAASQIYIWKGLAMEDAIRSGIVAVGDLRRLSNCLHIHVASVSADRLGWLWGFCGTWFRRCGLAVGLIAAVLSSASANAEAQYRIDMLTPVMSNDFGRGSAR
jgi:hypothetical protein